MAPCPPCSSFPKKYLRSFNPTSDLGETPESLHWPLEAEDAPEGNNYVPGVGQPTRGLKRDLVLPLGASGSACEPAWSWGCTQAWPSWPGLQQSHLLLLGAGVGVFRPGKVGKKMHMVLPGSPLMCPCQSLSGFLLTALCRNVISCPQNPRASV